MLTTGAGERARALDPASSRRSAATSAEPCRHRDIAKSDQAGAAGARLRYTRYAVRPDSQGPTRICPPVRAPHLDARRHVRRRTVASSERRRGRHSRSTVHRRTNRNVEANSCRMRGVSASNPAHLAREQRLRLPRTPKRPTASDANRRRERRRRSRTRTPRHGHTNLRHTSAEPPPCVTYNRSQRQGAEDGRRGRASRAARARALRSRAHRSRRPLRDSERQSRRPHDGLCERARDHRHNDNNIRVKHPARLSVCSTSARQPGRHDARVGRARPRVSGFQCEGRRKPPSPTPLAIRASTTP
mmetsp:Transcript_17063/g.59829  ORF Transcript_17063/g.59829 Transcript_17063/m.59829 type:complete len:302 (-) Transcript_17063:62-967(-)